VAVSEQFTFNLAPTLLDAQTFALQRNPPFRFSPCYLLADFSPVNFNRSTVIFYFFVRWVKIFALKTNTLQIKLQISEK